MTTITLSTDPASVVISVVVTFLGVHISSNLIEQTRIANIGIWNRTRRSIRLRALTACTLGGVSTWIAYCLAMGSSVFGNNIHSNNIIFDGGILSASMICSVILSFIGLCIGGTNDRIFDKSKIESMETSLLVGLALKNALLRNRNDPELIYMNRLRPILIGGCIHALGLLLTEYIGILSIVLTGNTKIAFDTNSVVLSCIIAWGGSTLSYWLLFRGLSMVPDRESVRILTSIIFTATISGSHFASLSSAQFNSPTNGATTFATSIINSGSSSTHDKESYQNTLLDKYTINTHELLILVVFLAIVIFWISATYVWMDLRHRFSLRADCLHKVDILMNTVEDLAIKHGEQAISFGTVLRRYREIQGGYDSDIHFLPYADSARSNSSIRRDPKVQDMLVQESQTRRQQQQQPQPQPHRGIHPHTPGGDEDVNFLLSHPTPHPNRDRKKKGEGKDDFNDEIGVDHTRSRVQHDMTQENQEIIMSSNAHDLDGRPLNVTHPPNHSTTHNIHKKSQHHVNNQNHQNSQNNSGIHPQISQIISNGEVPTQTDRAMNVGQRQGQGHTDGNRGNHEPQGRETPYHSPSQNHPTKEEQGIIGVAMDVTLSSKGGPNQSVKNQSDCRRSFLPSNLLESAKINKSEKLAEANRRDNSAGRIMSEGRDNFDEAMYPVPNDAMIHNNDISQDYRDPQHSTGDGTFQSVNYSGRSNQGLLPRTISPVYGQNMTPTGMSPSRRSSRHRALMGGPGILGGGPGTPGNNPSMIYGSPSGEYSLPSNNVRLGRNMLAAQHVATSLLRGVLSGFAGNSHKHLASQPFESKRDIAHRQRIHNDLHQGGTGGRTGGVIAHSPSPAGVVSPCSGGVSRSVAEPDAISGIFESTRGGQLHYARDSTREERGTGFFRQAAESIRLVTLRRGLREMHEEHTARQRAQGLADEA